MIIGTYFFDGDGKRVKKISPTETVIFVYDAGGKLVAEYSTQLSSTPQVQYLTNDHLGTPRVNTNQFGAVVSRSDYMPYGEEIVALGGRTSSDKYVSDDVRQGFTGYIKDDETNLDYAQARMYKKEIGRFTGADPLLSSGRQRTPQTWNRYAYVRNNPLRFVDPSGLCDAPAGLKPGQVGICFEAFIAARRVGAGDRGHGDGRTFDGNNPNLTARVTVWAIVSTDTEKVYVSKSEKIEKSVVTTGVAQVDRDKSTGQTEYREGTIALQGAAKTDAALSNINSKVGEKDFGAGVDVTVSIANGTNGAQQLSKDLQNVGMVTNSGPLMAAGTIGEAMSPAGTIDGNMTVRITGSGQVQYVGGEVKGYPSYALYTYTVGANGAVQTNEVRKVPENQIEDLTKPMKKVP